jgi:hypothetical protein
VEPQIGSDQRKCAKVAAGWSRIASA